MVSGLVLSVAKITQLWFSLCVCFKHKSLLMNVYFKTVNFHLVYLFKETNTSRLDGSLLLNSLMMRRRGYHMNKTLLWASPDCKGSIMSKIPSSPSGLKSVQGSNSGVNGCRIQPLFSLDLLFPAYKNNCGNITEISSSAASACHAGTVSMEHTAESLKLTWVVGYICTLQHAHYFEILADMPKPLPLLSWNLHAPSHQFPTQLPAQVQQCSFRSPAWASRGSVCGAIWKTSYLVQPSDTLIAPAQWASDLHWDLLVMPQSK